MAQIVHHADLFDEKFGRKEAVAYYKKAIAKDPGYALPYAGLAEAYSRWRIPGCPAILQKKTLPLARAAASRALQLDPSLTEAHVALGWSLLQDWNWQEAERGTSRCRAESE
jgi:adenylate cyclase